MKVFFSILFSATYLLLGTGMGMQAHFCGDELVELRFLGEEKRSCCAVPTLQDEEERTALLCCDVPKSAKGQSRPMPSEDDFPCCSDQIFLFSAEDQYLWVKPSLLKILQEGSKTSTHASPLAAWAITNDFLPLISSTGVHPSKTDSPALSHLWLRHGRLTLYG